MSTEAPPVIRQLSTGAARHLAALAAVFDELQTALHCCELLLPAGARESRATDPIEREALWTTALLSYARCFATGAGTARLTDREVSSTPLQGEVIQWHKMLLRLCARFADGEHSPRGQFSVGAATGAEGEVQAITITSTDPGVLDEQTIRQTGALALELSKLLDARIESQQQQLLDETAKLARDRLQALPLISISAS